MAKRRGKGEGSIYQRADGRWVGQVQNGFYANGRRKYVRVVRRTEAEAIQAKRALERGNADGHVLDGGARLDAFLTDWAARLGEIGGRSGKPLSAATQQKYRWAVKVIGRHPIAKKRLRDLRPKDVQAFVGWCRKSYSGSSVSDLRVALGTALAHAVMSDLIATNPASAVRVHQDHAGKLDDRLTAVETEAVLTAAKGDDLGVAAVLGLKLGLRIGEITALRWADVDFDADELHVRKAKTEAGKRTLPLLPVVADALRARKAAQAKERLECPVGLWKGGEHVLTGARGRQLSEGAVRSWWSRLLRKADVTHICRNCGNGKDDCSTSVRRFHASRHSAATALLEAGVPIEVVSAICGHSSIVITTQVYARVTADLKRKALSKLA